MTNLMFPIKLPWDAAAAVREDGVSRREDEASAR